MIDYMNNFFQVEIANERNGGISPATLGSAMDSLLQAPDDIIAEWAQVELSKVKEIFVQMEELIAEYTVDCRLSSLVYDQTYRKRYYED